MDSGCQSVDFDKIALPLRPVGPGESGDGLPYAPQDWPNPGDIWGWRVGNRKTSTGFMADRYLILPCRLQKTFHTQHFNSKYSAQVFIQKEFPEVDIEAFFASFNWRIPSAPQTPKKNGIRTPCIPSIQEKVEKSECESKKPGTSPCKAENVISSIPSKQEKAEISGFESKLGTLPCKAGNRICSLRLQARNFSLPAMDCDICCSESGFCRDCCCILCCKTVDWAYGGYSFIRCEAVVSESYICGHVAHLECALRAYMCGTVGGSIGLDVEYYCRRCDTRTDLTSHVTKIVQVCESLHTLDDTEKILKLGVCILRGSQQESTQKLLQKIGLTFGKLNRGPDREEVPDVKGNNPVVPPVTQESLDEKPSLHKLPVKQPVELRRKRQRPLTRAKSTTPTAKPRQPFPHSSFLHSEGEKGFILLPDPMDVAPLQAVYSQ
ncbi:hypothetical protein GIB67_021365 [Kingdonia uniflora]|uniref:Oberon PHD finger domain-containing protein n=1 Tax=Kingdonia uniflora TaxID=39325 RepID=A0A7J7MCT3_9MAGN|nr:hypothetical protein GIB67_021365 [Kingdonia uniflora]